MNALCRLRESLPDIVYRIAQILEIIVSIIVALAIILSFYTVLVELDLMVNDPAVGLHDFLGTAFNVVIGIEFLKMLCRHSVGSVVEVLLFALARGGSRHAGVQSHHRRHHRPIVRGPQIPFHPWPGRQAPP